MRELKLKAAEWNVSLDEIRETETSLLGFGTRNGVRVVLKLTKQLTTLNPAKAQQYYKIAIQKFEPAVAETQANKLAKTVIKIVQKSDLPESKINSLVKQVQKIDDKFVPPAPTPTPYQALRWMAPPVTSV